MNKDFENLLNKYQCKLVDDRIVNKNGNDTKIAWKSFAQLQENLKSIKSSNENQAMANILYIFEESLKERSVI